MNIVFDTTAVRAKLTDIQQRQIPYAISRTLNQTAYDVKAAEVREMGSVFDRPTPYTLNSVQVEPSNKGKLVATVRIKDTDRLGDFHHLMPEIRGGGRAWKRFEKLLNQYGYLPAGKYTVPGAGARIDQYGNMSPGQIVQILSYLRAFPEQGYMANITARSLKKNKKPREYILMRDGSGQPTGIYHKLPGNKFPMPVLIFADQPQYRRTFNFHEVAQKTIFANFKKNWRTEFANAMRTAK